MNKFVRCCVVVLLAATSQFTFATDIPRLWEVTGKNSKGILGKFYILPVTHNGFAIEHDRYFYKTVVPIALSSDYFLYERSRLLPSSAPNCSIPLPDTAENGNILKQAYADVERALFDLFPGPPQNFGLTERDREGSRIAAQVAAHEIARNLSEYGLLLMMQGLLHQTQRDHPERLPSPDPDYVSRPDIASYLAHIRQDNKKNESQSIDENSDLLEAYCNLGEVRARYLQLRLSLLDPTKFKYPKEDELKQYETAIAESFQRRELFVNLASEPPEFDYTFVCERNNKWLARMQDQLGNGVRFYALGMGHVFQPSPNNRGRCDGILKRLKDAGFTVTLVQN
jgi:hypothetical protein